MATGTAYSYENERHYHRFADDAFARTVQREPKPGKEQPAPSHCPYCQKPLVQSNVFYALIGGFRQLAVSLCMIFLAVLRAVRFVVASVLCLVGLIGSCFRVLGLRIAHPDDRRIF